jgi:hypothetical protein
MLLSLFASERKSSAELYLCARACLCRAILAFIRKLKKSNLNFKCRLISLIASLHPLSSALLSYYTKNKKIHSHEMNYTHYMYMYEAVKKFESREYASLVTSE